MNDKPKVLIVGHIGVEPCSLTALRIAELKESHTMKQINELKLKQKQARQQLTEIDENAIQGELDMFTDNK